MPSEDIEIPFHCCTDPGLAVLTVQLAVLTLVGAVLGLAVGELLGAAVGAAVGGVGVFVGVAVGVAVGALLGICVGVSLGEAVGLLVGDEAGVGAAVVKGGGIVLATSTTVIGPKIGPGIVAAVNPASVAASTKLEYSCVALTFLAASVMFRFREFSLVSRIMASNFTQRDRRLPRLDWTSVPTRKRLYVPTPLGDAASSTMPMLIPYPMLSDCLSGAYCAGVISRDTACCTRR